LRVEDREKGVERGDVMSETEGGTKPDCVGLFAGEEIARVGWRQASGFLGGVLETVCRDGMVGGVCAGMN
jgi:hypothetical protein